MGHRPGEVAGHRYPPRCSGGFLTARDPRIFDDPYFDERDPIVDRIEAPTFTVGAWHDLFGRSATGVYERLKMEPGRKQMIVGDGYHLDVGSGYGGKFAPPRLDVLERAWFDRWLKAPQRSGVLRSGHHAAAGRRVDGRTELPAARRGADPALPDAGHLVHRRSRRS